MFFTLVRDILLARAQVPFEIKIGKEGIRGSMLDAIFVRNEQRRVLLNCTARD